MGRILIQYSQLILSKKDSKLILNNGYKMEKVSVIIPVFNSEKFLKESIESILAQTYPNLEIVAVNDGSTDGSLTILENYSDKIIIISQDNKGLASALTTGINQMSGKWLKWFSPDDIMKPETISMLVNATKKMTQIVLFTPIGK